MSSIEYSKKQLRDIIKHNPKQTEKEIFTDTDNEGYNHNHSEQHNYPGIQKHDPKYIQNKT